MYLAKYSVFRPLRGRFRFRCVSIPDRQERNHLEAILIASLSACPVCRPSARWLGQFAYSENVRPMDMWNSEFVETGPLSAGDLKRFAAFKIGDTVRLKSGGPAMKVYFVPEDLAEGITCQWTVGEMRHRLMYPTEDLVAVDASDD